MLAAAVTAPWGLDPAGISLGCLMACVGIVVAFALFLMAESDRRDRRDAAVRSEVRASLERLHGMAAASLARSMAEHSETLREALAEQRKSFRAEIAAQMDVNRETMLEVLSALRSIEERAENRADNRKGCGR